MNYLLNHLERKISFLKSLNRKAELKPHLQAKLEFYLNLLLAYYWNKNLSSLELEDKEIVINEILRPSIGSIVSIIRKLDIENEIFGNKKAKKISTALDKYPGVRNQIIGHGYSYEDDIDNYLIKFEELISAIEDSDIWLINENYNLIYVDQTVNNINYGINYRSDGEYIAWQCPELVSEFQVKSLYIQKNDNEYHRISPFIYIKDESNFYTFCSIEEKLTGRTKYNKLISTGTYQLDNIELQSLLISDDGIKRKNSNGTVINSFKNNYNKYIDVGIASKIQNFLTKNNSSVYATLWGHGGVGKTASIQYVSQLLCQSQEKKFDYIIFLSAKDRYYNYYKGRIEKIDDNISSLDQIIQYINSIISNIPSFELESILNFEGKILLIFDDFETFSKEEKIKITDFISRLNINHHKVVITTRSANLITGIEIQTSELTQDETVRFFLEALKNEFPQFNRELMEKELLKEDFKEKIHEITSGRPLFILQLAVLLVQTSNLKDIILNDIKSGVENPVQ
ncbi:NB-ARC domain-containing protein, partial [Dysgonomonas sp. UBA7630]